MRFCEGLLRLEPLIAKLFYIDERGEGRDKVYSTVFLKDTILKKLQSNPVAQQMLQFGNNIGNLFPNEEALCMASAFMQDKQTRIVVKKNRYEAQQLYQRLKPLSRRHVTICDGRIFACTSHSFKSRR